MYKYHTEKHIRTQFHIFLTKYLFYEPERRFQNNMNSHTISTVPNTELSGQEGTLRRDDLSGEDL